MAWILCASGPAIQKAGLNANSDIIVSGPVLADWSTQAEGSIEAATGKTYISSFSSTPLGIQGSLNDVSSSMVAMKIIMYDTTGYLSREADTLLNVNARIIDRGLKDLADFAKIKLKSPV